MTTALKTWRMNAQLDAESAAKQVGVSLPTWSRWENGHRQVPADRVIAVERVTGISRHVLRPDVFGPEPTAEAAA